MDAAQIQKRDLGLGIEIIAGLLLGSAMNRECKKLGAPKGAVARCQICGWRLVDTRYTATQLCRIRSLG